MTARRYQSRIPRWMHHAYANVCGFFWLPCRLCGEYSGGHEWRDIDGKSSVIRDPDDPPGMYEGICPACTREGRGIDRWEDLAGATWRKVEGPAS